MYNKLLITAGGGIIKLDDQSPQDEAATLAIGLGGTGISCLRELKKQVYNKLKPDNEGAAIPEYSHIKFLAVDADRYSLGDEGSIDAINSDTEYFDISNRGIPGLLAHKAYLEHKHYLDWLRLADPEKGNNGLPILSAIDGAGGVRQAGRLLLLEKSNEFKNKISNLVSTARKNLPGGADINILIFTGLGGGTGSGTFLDVCYIVNEALTQMNLYGQAQICGFFFMPDVNLDKVDTDIVRTYIQVNGFAAMKELDYCMNFEKNGDEWNQQYNGFTVKTSEPPVKLAHLVTATAADGSTRTNGYDYAMHATTDYVMEFLVKPFVPQPNANGKTPEVFTLKSHIANIKNMVHVASKRNGGCYNYCVVGASNYYVPYKEINTYLVSKIFESLRGIDTVKPSENHLQNFIQSNGLRFEDIASDLASGVPAVPLREVDAGMLYEQVQGINTDTVPQCLKYIVDSKAVIYGKIAENKSTLLSDGIGAVKAEKGSIRSIISKIKSGVDALASSAKAGPYFAAAILHDAASQSLDNIIDGYSERCTAQLNQEQANLSERDESLSVALSDLQNSNILNRKKRANAYTAAVQSYYTERKQIELYTQLKELLAELKDQVTGFYNSTYKPLTDVVTEIKDSFEANLRELTNFENTPTGYAKPLMTMQELSGSLDRSVESMDSAKIVGGFFAMMVKNPDIWREKDESKICKAVSDHFLIEIGSYTSKTIVNYLQIKFGTQIPATLSNKIYNEILVPACNEASPLFWANGTFFTPHATGYCSIPQQAAEIKMATSTLTTNGQFPWVKERPLECTDTISVLEFLCAVPMFGYQGLSIYYDEYCKHMNDLIGKHLYEGDRVEKDYSKLPNVFPCSVSNGTAFEEASAESKALIEKALETKVVYFKQEANAKKCFIVKYDETLLNQYFEAANNVRTSDQAAALLKNLPDTPPIASSIAVSTGDPAYYDKIVEDNLANSVKFLDIIKNNIALNEKYTAMISELREKADQIALIQDFANAYSSGIIVRDLVDIYQYYYETNGLLGLEKHVLTNIDQIPYGEDLPLYSAYVAYVNLSSEERAEIKSLVHEAKVKNGIIVKETKEEVRRGYEQLSDEMLREIGLRHADESDVLADFVRQIARYIQ